MADRAVPEVPPRARRQPSRSAGDKEANDQARPAPLPAAALERSIVRRGKAQVVSESAASETDLENRRRIVEAGHRVFSRDGFHGARILDIAAEARLGVGTLYRHFGSKADIFEAVIKEVIDEIYVGGSLSTATGAEPFDRIRAANRSFLRFYSRSANIMSTLNHLATQDDQFRALYLERRNRSVSRLAYAIERLQENGEANPLLDPLTAADSLIAMMADVAFTAFRVAGSRVEDVDVETLNLMWAGALGLDTAKSRSQRP